MKFSYITERNGEEVTLSTFMPKEGQNLSDAATETAISTLIGYAKIEKLLHKQLWDKDQLKANGVAGVDYVNYDNSGNVTSYVPDETRVNMVDYEITINGRTAKPIKFWNIKSWSVNPYSPTDLYALGLNQLFVGQSPYAKYEGNPKDGIYHDDCLIQPKGEDLPSYDRYGWYIKGHGHWVEKDEFGEILVENVFSYEKTEVSWVEPINNPVLNSYGEVLRYVDFHGNILTSGYNGTNYIEPTVVAVYDETTGAILSYTDILGTVLITGYDDNGTWVEPIIVPITENDRLVRYEDENGNTLIEERLEWIEPVYNPVYNDKNQIIAYTDGNGQTLIEGHIERNAPVVVAVYDENDGRLLSYNDTDGNVVVSGYWDEDVWIDPVGYPLYSSTNGALLAYTDINGNILIYGEAILISIGWFYKVVTPDGSTEYELTEISTEDENSPTMYYPSVEYINFSQWHSSSTYPIYSQYVEIPDMSEHGAMIYESEDVGYTRPIGSFTRAMLFGDAPRALTRVYADGTAVQFTAPVIYEYTYDEGTIGRENISGSIKYLPLVYMDSGDLVQNRVDYIESWDDMFELYVHEDGYWYDALVSVIVVVVSVIVSILAAPGAGFAVLQTTPGTLAAMGGFISGIGVVSGNKTLGIIGSIMTLGASVYAQGAQAISKTTATQAATESATQAAVQEVTVLEAFKGLANVGMMNQLKLALNLAGVGFQIAATAESADTLPDADRQAEDGMRTGGPGEEEEEDYIDKVMNIGIKPIDGMYDAAQLARI